MAERVIYVPELRFIAVNATDSSWRRIDLDFEIIGSCPEGDRVWHLPVAVGHWAGSPPTETYLKAPDGFLDVDRCQTKAIHAKLVSADGSKFRVEESGKVVDIQRGGQEDRGRKRSH